MKKHLCCYLALLCLFVFLAACVPYSFSPPTQIHITGGDHVEQPVISMDDEGRSHIAGVVNDRIVYYRTTFGAPTRTLAMTMSSTGTNWKQYNPDIAATDSGSAWLVWVEQRGGPEKFACYREIPLLPPIGGYETYCNRLSSTTFTTGNVMVVTSGNVAYALYDHIDASSRIGSISYKELTDPSNTGIVYWYSDMLESGYLYSWDAGIDQDGYLHVAFLDNDGIVPLPYTQRLIYRSNRTTHLDGEMTQGWFSSDVVGFEVDAPISLALFMDETTEVMAVASTLQSAGVDWIWLHTCFADGCGSHVSQFVDLPTAWETHSVITDVKLVGTDDQLHLGFIGDNDPDLAPQVYFKQNAFDSAVLWTPSGTRATFKYDLEGVEVDPRPESSATESIVALSWGETNFSSVQYYSYDEFNTQTKVYDTDCVTSLVQGEVVSNGIYHAGVWEACLDTWFSSKAYLNQLPLIIK